ncbi:MAG: hypothetical protein J1F25_06125, partial [Prevotellaceae bacterium]|nr:hypothetical protein [Prevotellaceae bacterium]
MLNTFHLVYVYGVIVFANSLQIYLLFFTLPNICLFFSADAVFICIRSLSGVPDNFGREAHKSHRGAETFLTISRNILVFFPIQSLIHTAVCKNHTADYT